MANQHVFFENIGSKPKVEITEEQKTYLKNCLIFEVTANWIFIQKLVNKYKDGKLTQVDQAEKDWLNFIIENSIDINKYENSEQFINDYLKIK